MKSTSKFHSDSFRNKIYSKFLNIIPYFLMYNKEFKIKKIRVSDVEKVELYVY